MNLKLGAPGYFLFLVALIIFAGLKEHYDWHGRWYEAIYGGFGALLMQLFRETSKLVRDYQPISKLDAKVTNERVKLLTTTINAVALAVGAVGVIAPLVSAGDGPLTNPLRAIAIIFALWMHLAASQMLKNLKDEDQPFSPPTVT